MLEYLLLITGLFLLVKGADYLIEGSSNLGKLFKIKPLILGLTVIAIGTSLPELAVAVAAARKKKADIIIGTVLGSNIYNILIVIGASAMISPLTITSLSISYALPIMLLMTASLLYFIRRHWMLRSREGLVLLCIYILFLLGLIFWV